MSGRTKVLGMLATVVLLSGAVTAQEKEKDPRLNPPVAPIGAESTSKAPTAAPVPVQQIEREPLAGNRWLGLDSLQKSRNTLTSSVAFSSGADVGPGAAGGTRVNSQSQINGSLMLRRQWGKGALNLDYNSGGVLYSTTGQRGSFVQALGISQTLAVRRWTFTISDGISYLPETGFGAPLLGNVGQNTFNNNGFLGGNPINTPMQTIFTGGGDRITNNASGQANYDFSRRTSFTVSGSHGILRFLGGQGLIDSNSFGVQTGLNHMFGRGNTVAVYYAYQQSSFGGVQGGIQNQSLHLSYARRITGRLSFQASAGPQFRDSNIVGRPARDQISWNAASRFLLALDEMSLGLSYSHGAALGSGVFLGAVNDMVEATLSRQLSRKWTTTFGAGYAHNRSLTQLPVGTARVAFDTWHATANVARTIGRNLQMNASYTYQNQSQNGCLALPVCTASGSGRHVFNLGLQYQFRPIEFN